MAGLTRSAGLEPRFNHLHVRRNLFSAIVGLVHVGKAPVEVNAKDFIAASQLFALHAKLAAAH